MMDHRFEFATPMDPALNYCLWPYPAPAPAEDKFRSINLLFQSFDYAGIDPRAFAIVEALRGEIGPFKTVFGIKMIDGRLAWEFYFYDYKRRQRDVSVSRVLRALRDFLPTSVQANENLPYFMFSFDLNHALAAGREQLDVVHIYIGNPGSQVSSGIAYAVRSNQTAMENFYFFFDAASHMGDVAKKVGSSAVFDQTRVPLEAVIMPELRRCRTICVANKTSHDCIYFSGIDIRQLQWFLDRLDYPEAISTFVKQNTQNLDHLLFDVGIDYKVSNNEILLMKSGYYGVF